MVNEVNWIKSRIMIGEWDEMTSYARENKLEPESQVLLLQVYDDVYKIFPRYSFNMLEAQKAKELRRNITNCFIKQFKENCLIPEAEKIFATPDILRSYYLLIKEMDLFIKEMYLIIKKRNDLHIEKRQALDAETDLVSFRKAKSHIINAKRIPFLDSDEAEFALKRKQVLSKEKALVLDAERKLTSSREMERIFIKDMESALSAEKELAFFRTLTDIYIKDIKFPNICFENSYLKEAKIYAGHFGLRDETQRYLAQIFDNFPHKKVLLDIFKCCLQILTSEVKRGNLLPECCLIYVQNRGTLQEIRKDAFSVEVLNQIPKYYTAEELIDYFRFLNKDTFAKLNPIPFIESFYKFQKFQLTYANKEDYEKFFCASGLTEKLLSFPLDHEQETDLCKISCELVNWRLEKGFRFGGCLRFYFDNKGDNQQIWSFLGKDNFLFTPEVTDELFSCCKDEEIITYLKICTQKTSENEKLPWSERHEKILSARTDCPKAQSFYQCLFGSEGAFTVEEIVRPEEDDKPSPEVKDSKTEKPRPWHRLKKIFSFC